MERVTIHAVISSDIYQVDDNNSEFYVKCLDSGRRLKIYAENTLLNKVFNGLGIDSKAIIDGYSPSAINTYEIEAKHFIKI
jgi:hypothetical protein